MRGRLAAIAALAVVMAGAAWLLLVGLPRWYGPQARASAARPANAAAAPASGRKIKVRLYYLSMDGSTLTSIERDVPYGDTTAAQAQEIVAAQIAPVAEPLVSAVPAGTRLRALYVGDHGQAYVDLSREVSSAHGGGTLDELLTVYTIVDALTANLPAITSVQLLVDGKQVDTLAGHVDLREPLAKNLTYVE